MHRAKLVGKLLGAIIAAALAGSCSSNDDVIVCGNDVCGLNETCDMASSPPMCRCVPGYAGSDCSQCANGYTQAFDGSCQLAPVDCGRGSAACSRRGTCVPAGGPGLDSCQCNTGFGGIACETCAAGYQDNDGNGSCEPTCSNPQTQLSCPAPRTCSDATGRVQCSCPDGTTGSNCEQCMSGLSQQSNGTCIRCPEGSAGDNCAFCMPNFKKQPDGSCVACPAGSSGIECADCISGFARDPVSGQCVKACRSNGECGANGICDTAQPVPSCTCKPGFAGAGCNECAEGFVRDGTGQCVRLTIPAGTTFIGGGRIAGVNTLLAINGNAGTATALRPLPAAGVTQLAADTTAKQLFAVNNQGIHKLDMASGALTMLSTTVSPTLTMGADGLYTLISQSPYLLKRINATTGAVADIAASNLAGVQGLAFETLTSTFFALRWSGVAPELHRVAANAMPTLMGSLVYEAERLPAGGSQVGLAVEPGSGALFMAAAVGRTPREILVEHCLKVGVGVGLTGYTDAAFTSIDYPAAGIGAGVTKKLASSKPSGKEVVVYASNNATAAATAGILSIETLNPDTFVCIMTQDENLKLFVAQTAKFAGIVFTGDAPRLELEIEGVREVTMPQIHVYARSDGFVRAVDAFEIARVYSRSEWTTQKQLPWYSSVWGSDSAAPVRLVKLDLSTRKPSSIVSFPDIELLPLLAPWVP